MGYPSAPLRAGQRMHDMMPVAEHDEMSRQLFLQSFLQDIGERREPGNETVWAKSVQPRFRKEHGREPKNVAEMRKAMLQEPYIQVWSSLKRIAKELQYESAGPMVERQLPELIDKAEHYRTSNRKLGSLTLDPSIKAPRYNSEIEIHVQPGGYHVEVTEQDDVFAGALWDRVYTLGEPDRGEWGDLPGIATSNWIKEQFPDLKPTKILDVGCTIGQSTLPYCDAFPDAEIHAIDVGAPVLRYGHARAEALGKKVHFSQQDGEKTRFKDGSFDLIFSHLLFHETSRTGVENIFREGYRLLKPGGVMFLDDIPDRNRMEQTTSFFFDWMTHNAAEPFINGWIDTDRQAVAERVGFDRKKAKQGGPQNRYFAFRK